MKKHPLICLVVGSLWALSCGNSYSSSPNPPPPPSGGSTVQSGATSFSPANITVSAGTTVTWRGGSTQHTVTSGSGSAAADAGKLFDMQLGVNGMVTYTFATPGTFPYFCRIHESMGMKGTVTVTAGTGGTGGSGGTGGTGGYGG